jgi:glycosyltransferase involved in cell wall biosynthesis
MRVAFISRATLFSSPGGDTKQVERTAHHLRALGVAVDIFCTNERIDYTQYDLLHFFNIIRPADIICHIKASRKPYVVSTIYVEYDGVKTEGGGGMQGLLRKVFSGTQLEYIKVIARALKNGEKIMSREYLWMGHKDSMRYVAKQAACLLPNSESEYRRFAAACNIVVPYHVVPNGIDEEATQQQYPHSEKYTDAILCMGRIETRKNQLNLIRALNNTSYRVFIHGKPSPNNMAYYEQCKAEAATNITIGDWLDQEELFTAYANAKLHILPSWFETTGLSSLEAAVMGCNIVVTDKGDTRDYFGNDAWYCEPDDIASIRSAVDEAFRAPYNEAFRERILQQYTWRRAGEETLAAYKNMF